MMSNPYKIGDIIVYSIGGGCDEFWQIIRTTPKTIRVKKLKYKITKHNPKFQTMDIKPIKDDFEKPEMNEKYLGDDEHGNPIFGKPFDTNEKTLKVKKDGTIGPTIRLCGWWKYKGKALNQYSP